jgi:hypothetical protein
MMWDEGGNTCCAYTMLMLGLGFWKGRIRTVEQTLWLWCRKLLLDSVSMDKACWGSHITAIEKHEAFSVHI